MDLEVNRFWKRCQAFGAEPDEWPQQQTSTSHHISSWKSPPRQWELGSCLPGRRPLLKSGCRYQSGRPPLHLQRLRFQSGDGTTRPQLTRRRGQGGEARMRRTHPTPHSLAPGPPLPALSPTHPVVPRSRDEILTRPQRKYLRPFGVTGSLHSRSYSEPTMASPRCSGKGSVLQFPNHCPKLELASPEYQQACFCSGASPSPGLNCSLPSTLWRKKSSGYLRANPAPDSPRAPRAP